MDRAGRDRPGPTPPARVAPPANTLGFELFDFIQFENIAKRDIKRIVYARLVTG